MAAEIATDVLIIEDETFIAMDLESLVRNLGHHVIGVARTTPTRLRSPRTKSRASFSPISSWPMVFGPGCRQRAAADLRGPGGVHHRIPGAFLTGERPEPAFLISKPFQPAMVSAVASQGAVLPAQLTQPRAKGGVRVA